MPEILLSGGIRTCFVLRNVVLGSLNVPRDSFPLRGGPLPNLGRSGHQKQAAYPMPPENPDDRHEKSEMLVASQYGQVI